MRWARLAVLMLALGMPARSLAAVPQALTPLRLEYKLEPGGTVSGQFAIAPPGSPDAFKTYLTWDMERQGKQP